MKTGTLHSPSCCTVAIVTFGCLMNEYDSKKMKGLLADKGYRLIDDYRKADVVLLNTCAVREKSEHKVFSLIGRLMQIRKQQKRHILIGVGGCSGEVSRAYLKEHFPDLDILFTPGNFVHIAEMLEQARSRQNRGYPPAGGKQSTMTEHVPEQDDPVVPSMFEGCGAVAEISVTMGCDNSCAYCIVPRARGKEVSRSPERIMQEVHLALQNGAKEIILLGQNVNSYRYETTTFPLLLEQVAQTEGVKRLRFVTSHPKDVSDELTEVVARNGNICRHLHLPVQSGSDRVLEAMKRGYTFEHYRKRVNRFKERVPGMSFSTDIIIGFPGETEEDFEETFRAVQEMDYETIYLFKYSPRAGTSAFLLEDSVSPEEKQRRFDIVLEYQSRRVYERNRSLEGKIVEVLVGAVPEKGDCMLSSRMENGTLVHFLPPEGREITEGSFCKVRITAGKPHSLRGEFIS